MATKRQPSKQRRQTQNQRERAALQARRAAAAAAGAAPAGKVGATKPTGSASGGSVLSRLRGATATGRTARTRGTGGGTGRTGRGGLPVGHRAALSALLAAVAGAVIGAVLFRIPVDRSGDAIASRETLVAEWILSVREAGDEPPADADAWLPGGSQPYAQAYWPLSATVVLPIIGTGLGFRAVARRSRAKLVNRTMYVTLFGALLSSQLLLIFLPAVISLAVAAFQVRKAEVAASAADADGNDVIEVDEVDDLDVEDEAIEDEYAIDDDVAVTAADAGEPVNDSDKQR